MEDRFTLRLEINQEIDNYIKKIEEIHKDKILKIKDKVSGYIGIIYYCLGGILETSDINNIIEINEHKIKELKDVIDQAKGIEELAEIRMKKEKENGQKI